MTCLRQLQAAFEAFLDVLKWQMDNCSTLGLPQEQAEEAEGYLREVARNMLALGKSLLHREHCLPQTKGNLRRLFCNSNGQWR